MRNRLEEQVDDRFIVPGGYGRAFHVKAGQTVTITDLEGQQVVDFIAFSADDVTERLSVAQTRTGLGPQGSIYVREGDVLLTNLRRPLAKIVEDTVNVHDLLIAACDPNYYREEGMPEHRSCQQNFMEVLAPYGIAPWQIPDPFNIFQNTKVQADGVWVEGEPPSKAGDYIRLQFMMDALCAVSACPFDLYGFNGGKATSIQVTIGSCVKGN